MSYPLSAIAGVGLAMAARLKAHGIRTTEKLLEASKTVKARKILAETEFTHDALDAALRKCAEYLKIKAGQMRLPHGWKVGELIPRPADNGEG